MILELKCWYLVNLLFDKELAFLALDLSLQKGKGLDDVTRLTFDQVLLEVASLHKLIGLVSMV